MPIIGSIPPVTAPQFGIADHVRFPRIATMSELSSASNALHAGGGSVSSSSGAAALDFGAALEKAISAVNAKQSAATQVTREVLLGENDKLHQSMVAMQESSVAFSLMVEVRNKVVEGYQELMRMPV